MKSMIIIAAFSACILISCGSGEDKTADNKSEDTKRSYDKIEKADWLVGSWKAMAPNGYTTETWTKQNDSVYTCQAITINGKDTASMETVTLQQRGDSMFYMPTVKDQNNGQPVSFALTSSSDNELVFENPQHDFPKKIRYSKINADSLVAEISGPLNGQDQVIPFHMSKIK